MTLVASPRPSHEGAQVQRYLKRSNAWRSAVVVALQQLQPHTNDGCRDAPLTAEWPELARKRSGTRVGAASGNLSA